MITRRNQVTIVGSMNSETQITKLQSGAIVARFVVAVPKKTKNSGESSELLKMFAWGNTAAFVRQYCDKGNQVAVTGKLVNRTYLSPEGRPRKITEIEVRQVIRL